MNDPRAYADNVNAAQEDIEVWNKLQFENKRIEPSQNFASGNVNKNLTMGNIDKKEYTKFSLKSHNARLQKNIPFEYGGWLTEKFANINYDDIEYTMTMSRSVKGLNQKLLVTRFSEEKKVNTEEEMLSGVIRRKK